jgi:conjugal transfer/type IV secretion protein DotA/TraY
MTNKIVKSITVPAAFKYALLPGIIPRIVEIWRSGFSTVALLMAQIFFNIGLLPIGHTYLKAENFGKFGIFNVLIAAKHNLIFDRKHLDQVVVFGLISTAIFLIFAQIIALIFALLIPGAWAQLFTTQDPTNDIAFVLLDRIFGVPTTNALTGLQTGFFGSCVGDTVNDCIAMRHDGSDSAVETVPVPLVFPWPFHLALHQMFAFYSYSIAAVALFILLYFIATIILETVQSGTPFGKRFSRLWAPLRLIMAFGLIVPISNGLNLGQYSVLYSAKWGSSLATNVWQQFNTQLTVNGLMEADTMVGTPVANDAMEIIGYLHMANLCYLIERNIFKRKYVHPAFRKIVAAYLINPNTDDRLVMSNAANGFQTYADARTFSSNGDIIMRIGSMDPARYLPAWAAGQPIPEPIYNEAGGVRPYCGEIIFPAVNTSTPGPELIQRKYYELIASMWLNEPGRYTQPTCPNTQVDQSDGMYYFGQRLFTHAQRWAQDWFGPVPAITTSTAPITTVEEIKVEGAVLLRQHLNCIIEASVDAERAYISANNIGLVPQELLDRGWAGAGIWYNRIAEINGALIDSINGMPAINLWPLTMQRVAEMRGRNEPNYIRADLFNPDSPAFVDGAILPRAGERTAARAYYELYKLWLADGPGTGGRGAQGNSFESAIAWIFGIEGLYSMTDNTTGVNNVHPLAKLSGLGKSLIEGSIRNLSMGAGAMIADLVTGADNPLSGAGDFAGALGSALVSAASITLTAGFVLFYIVPMLPFMYFFFAVGTWIKTVFEAMIGVPLWALSHLHIDGGGLPGQGAANGYYLVFEIFVRPVMIIMGFIASITIFSAMSNVLIDIWNIVIANVGGSGDTEALGLAESIRAPVDKMFYLVMFTMLLYMIGVSSFKLVDQIPQSILRWIGASVPTFVDQKDDITSSLVSKSSMYANRIFGGFTGAMTDKYKGIKGRQDAEAQYQAKLKAEQGETPEQKQAYEQAKKEIIETMKQDPPTDATISLRQQYPALYRGIYKGSIK